MNSSNGGYRGQLYSLYIYIYIYKERERDRETGRQA